MSLRLVFTPEAQEQLVELFHYIAVASSPNIAENYTDGIVSYCESLTIFPHRGTMREDVRSGLRITHYKKRTVIAFAVEAEQISIIGVFYGGQDYEAILQTDEDLGLQH